MTGNINDLGNTGNGIIEYVVGMLQPFHHAAVFIDLFEFFVEDHD